MHELSLCQGIVDLACQQAAADGARRVLRVRIAIGSLSHVEPSAIEFSYDVVSRGTLADGSVLEIERPAGRGHCLGCETVVTITARDQPCPHCGGHRWVLIGGDELRVLELEVE